MDIEYEFIHRTGGDVVLVIDYDHRRNHARARAFLQQGQVLITYGATGGVVLRDVKQDVLIALKHEGKLMVAEVAKTQEDEALKVNVIVTYTLPLK